MRKSFREITGKTIAESPLESHITAAWANIYKTKPVSNVSVPDEMHMRDAKDWVDANQK